MNPAQASMTGLFGNFGYEEGQIDPLQVLKDILKLHANIRNFPPSKARGFKQFKQDESIYVVLFHVYRKFADSLRYVFRNNSDIYANTAEGYDRLIYSAIPNTANWHWSYSRLYSSPRTQKCHMLVQFEKNGVQRMGILLMEFCTPFIRYFDVNLFHLLRIDKRCQKLADNLAILSGYISETNGYFNIDNEKPHKSERYERYVQLVKHGRTIDRVTALRYLRRCKALKKYAAEGRLIDKFDTHIKKVLRHTKEYLPPDVVVDIAADRVQVTERVGFSWVAKNQNNNDEKKSFMPFCTWKFVDPDVKVDWTIKSSYGSVTHSHFVEDVNHVMQSKSYNNIILEDYEIKRDIYSTRPDKSALLIDIL